MKLGKAIKNLTELRDGCGPEMRKYIDACNLGIEALKYIRYRDNCPGINTRLLLQGETEEIPK